MLRKILWSLLGLIVGFLIGSKGLYQSFTTEFFIYCVGGLVCGFLVGVGIEKYSQRKLK
jgi:hypothetical protein